jgi:hypothetical protein
MVFGATQLLGQICFWIWPLFRSPFEMFLWGTGLVLQFPGNVVSEEIVEELFWMKMSMVAMSVVAFPLGVLINAFLWALVGFCFSRLIRALRKTVA